MEWQKFANTEIKRWKVNWKFMHLTNDAFNRKVKIKVEEPKQ